MYTLIRRVLTTKCQVTCRLRQVARTLRDQLRATKILVCGETTRDFCHSCREQQISNMFDKNPVLFFPHTRIFVARN